MTFLGPPPHVRAGDWRCPELACPNNKAYVFAKNGHCPKCGSPKPDVDVQDEVQQRLRDAFSALQGVDSLLGRAGKEAEGLEESMRGLRSLMRGLGSNNNNNNNNNSLGSDVPPWVNPGDWRCPNEDCKNHKSFVFASKIVCPECFAAKPAAHLLSTSKEQWGDPRRSAVAYTSGISSTSSHALEGKWSPPPWVGPTDWACPNLECKNNRAFVFGSRACAKPSQPTTSSGAGHVDDFMGRRVGQSDWPCPNIACRNHWRMVFGSKESCPECGCRQPDDEQMADSLVVHGGGGG
eukprot:CAMPEP_0170617102 /NCGR_PEP_ID=MMETSP0224-20130122/26228_1 /TAXON_ID=285029 /ORGANISM="Togula jolla, Strain CCCM 725" /LENGTH=292 /DNA_ID=CAMNT_0010942951 /DNA_START=42 /DNA_END=916 /DNA_ORIENTATION=-